MNWMHDGDELDARQRRTGCTTEMNWMHDGDGLDARRRYFLDLTGIGNLSGFIISKNHPGTNHIISCLINQDQASGIAVLLVRVEKQRFRCFNPDPCNLV